MALQLDALQDAERERIESHLGPVKAAVRRHDPEAHFGALRPGHMPEFWELDAYVRPDLADDLTLLEELGEAGTDLLLAHDVAVLVLRHVRQD